VITLGVDVGSLTGKALVLEDGRIRSWEIVPTGPDSARTGAEVTERTLGKAGLALGDMDYIVSTGYGRIVIPFAHKNVSEISCHARGANWFFPSVRTILDMGGQDCKAIRCDASGKVVSFLMNDKCAAGAGRSMGIMADLVNVPLEEIGPLSTGCEGVRISSTCVVFARSEVLTYLRKGVPRGEILAGACQALANRVAGLLRRIGVERDFMVSGGIAKNVGVVSRLAARFDMEPRICFEPQIVGALGAALFAVDLHAKRAAGPRRRSRRAG
jgi:predicted CoA-substrate-specific enzyme activase